MKRFFLSLLFLCQLLFCLNLTAQTADLELPAVPDTLRTPADRAAYVIMHYWNSFDFDKDPRINDNAFVEQAFVNQLSVMPIATEDAQRQAVQILIARIASNPDAFGKIMALAEKYLFQLDSPFASDALYGYFIDEAIKSPRLGATRRTRLQSHKDIIELNRPGTAATDFTFTDSRGTTRKLSETGGDNRKLLIFYDPDCSHCNEAIDIISRKANLTGIDVIAVYSGEDIDLWTSHQARMPQGWTIGYEDGAIQDNDLYVFRTMPTVFLLDRNNIVLLKEPQIDNLLKYLSNNR